MKMRKVMAGLTAFAAVSALSVSASAADWSKAGYADNDPSTVNIISTDANGATFTETEDGGNCKLRITLSDILENPDDVSNIYSGSWTITYNGLSSFTGTDVGWLGGGAYCATGNSTGFGLSPNEWAEDGTAIWEDSQSVQDDFKWLLPSSVPSDASEAEFVFMDWSGQPLVTNNVTLTISDLKLFDKDGNEIAQKAYGGSSDSAPEEAAPTEDTSADDASAPAETEAAPVADTSTAPVQTGNAGVAGIAAVMAVAGAAAFVAKKK